MIEFICPKCNKLTEDTIGGVLYSGFLLECSHCFEITVVHFGNAPVEQSRALDVATVCPNCGYQVSALICTKCGTPIPATQVT